MDKHVIQTPAAATVTANGARGMVVWDSSFGRRRTADFSRVQCFIDGEVLRCTDPYVPMRDGYLIKSGVLNTDIGSGEVKYGGPYAHRLYTHPQYNFDTNKHARAGAQWFERMKTDHCADILRGARKEAGAK